MSGFPAESTLRPIFLNNKVQGGETANELALGKDAFRFMPTIRGFWPRVQLSPLFYQDGQIFYISRPPKLIRLTEALIMVQHCIDAIYKGFLTVADKKSGRWQFPLGKVAFASGKQALSG
jgi:hypothetical protein